MSDFLGYKMKFLQYSGYNVPAGPLDLLDFWDYNCKRDILKEGENKNTSCIVKANDH